MKSKTLVRLAVCVLLTGTSGTLAQSPFRNLGFESAGIAADTPPGPVAIHDAVPGWEVLINGTSQQTILFNTGTIGTSSASLLRQDNSLAPVIDGKYMFHLWAGADPSNSVLPANVTLRQTGFITADAQALYFKAYFGGGLNQLSDIALSVNGHPVSILTIAVTSHYTLYGGDLSSYAGSSSELSLTAISRIDVGGGSTVIFLDSLSFSPVPVPEPGPLALVGVGCVILVLTLRRRGRKAMGSHLKS